MTENGQIQSQPKHVTPIQLQTHNENICSNNKGTQVKGKIGWNFDLPQESMIFWVSPLFSNVNVLFLKGFLSLNLCMIKLIILCFPYFYG